ncbi:AraC family transcriptional regulator [Lysobacter hankyongensis]|uniref:AraC family transcriptional regulator CmrA n=1 Tax=Lysobacter hankyongensis TaxID=1176535 RepID=A0ABP9AFK8_9GAMM
MPSIASIAAPEFRDRAPALAELAARLARIGGGDGVHDTPVAGAAVIRASAPSQPLPAVYDPSVCIVVQGRKHALFDGATYVYDPMHCLIVSTSLPITGRIIEASSARPYLCLRIDLDPRIVEALSSQVEEDAPGDSAPGRALLVAETSPALLDAALRLVRLADEPDAAPVLAPLAMREIHFRLLTGALGPQLRALCRSDGQARRVGRAIALLRERYAEPLRIEALAEAAHMSASSLYERFREVTAMSPLQFQKRLRLQEARRLMLSDGLEAAAAAHRVGYESPSHFSREYRRLFGAPPRRDAATARAPD